MDQQTQHNQQNQQEKLNLSVREELEYFFQFCPKELIPRKEATKSKRTRPPGRYDLHLEDHLTLKHVKHLSSLTNDISTVAEKAASRAELPPIIAQGDFPLRGRSIPSEFVANETGISNHYFAATASYCLPIASTLALHPGADNWWKSLAWTTENCSGRAAIADGFLELRLPCPREEVRKFIEPEMLEAISEVRKRARVLATWELKSLAAGEEDTMLEVMKLSELGEESVFPWDHCGSCSKHIPTIGRNSELIDSTETPWVIPSAAPVSRPSREELSATQRPEGSHASQEPVSQSQESFPGGISQGFTGSGWPDDEDYVPSQQPMGPSSTTHARHVVQQAWAQAVLNDNSLLVLHSGNHEIIGVRHRKSQTLYVSDLINVPNYPGYGKLQIGLYISALRDAINRALQLRDLEVHEQKIRKRTRDSDNDDSESGSERSKKKRRVSGNVSDRLGRKTVRKAKGEGKEA